jgi:hypothetical protein
MEIEMALIAQSSGGKEFKPVPQGAHVGRCYRVIDLGTQTSEFQGKKRVARKVLLAWELFGEDEDGQALLTDDGRPLSITKRYTLSLSEKASLRADLEAWRGRAFTEDELAGFDLHHLLGVYALVNVTHSSKDGRTYSNVAGLSPLPKAMREHKPLPINANQFFDVTDPDKALFETFSDKLKETIQSCQQWNKKAANEAAKDKDGMAGAEDDIPW